MNHRYTTAGLGLAAVAGIVLSVSFWGDARAQQQAEPQGEATLQVGTLQPQLAFQQWEGRTEAIAQLQELQVEAQQAQQAGDQAQLLDVQGRMQQAQQDLLGKFEEDLKAALPEVAEKAGVKVIAVNVAYTADDVETKDVTPQVIEAFGGDPNAVQQPMIPGMGQ